MSLTGIAIKAGVTSSRLDQFIRNGEASPGFAVRIGTTSANITNFVNGTASSGIAQALGTTTRNAQLLRDLIGRQGAIGLIIGLACGMDREDQ